MIKTKDEMFQGKINFGSLRNSIFLMVLFMSMSNIFAIDLNINNYYKNVPTVKTVKLEVKYRWDNKGDDTALLQSLIDKNSGLSNGSKKGVTILIPNGVYFFHNVFMKSNVHLLINKNAVIHLAKGFSETNRNKHIFRFGPDNRSKVENSSIQCMSAKDGDKFTIDLRKYNGASKNMPITISNVFNFKIRGLRILEKRSQFQGIDLSPGKKPGGGFARPVKGIIQDIEIQNADYGYGLVQMHCGKNIFFKNLSGVGGTTLRLETDYRGEADTARFLVIENVVARDIFCKNGNSAVTLSPHERDNLIVDIDRVKADNCGWGVRIEDSFTANAGKRFGKFSHLSKIRNVSVIYGNNARVKRSHIDRYSCRKGAYTLEKNPLLPVTNTLGYKGPSVAAVLHDASYTVNFNIDRDVKVIKSTIGNLPKVIRGNVNCSKSSLIDNNNEASELFIQDNKNLKITGSKEDIQNIQIYNSLGQIVYVFDSKELTTLTTSNLADVSNLKAGVYIAIITKKSGQKKLKFIKQ